ncbi:MAG: MFS transporter [Gammaproteobacteria bacterium]|nr:MFS transporter [Gammaproteobacteria bacterium]
MTTKPFQGWRVLCAATIGLACGIATVVPASFGVFLGPLRAEFGWTQSETFTALLFITFTSALLAAPVGGLVDRYGARRVVLAGFGFQILLLASFSRLGPELWAYYLRYFLLAVLALGTTHVAFARVITLWFDRRRGLALGIALSGVGVGGFLWPLYAQAMIGAYGWRQAWLLMALAVAALALPVVGLLLRDSPASVGQMPDGDPPRAVADATAAPVEATGIPLAGVLRMPRYWLMVATFFLIGFAVQSVMLHLVPLLTARGLPPMLAALAQSLLFVAVTTGRLATGWLMDRYFAPRVALAFLIAPIVGISLLALGAGGTAALVAALLVGLAVGAEVDVLAYLTSRYFGARSFSAIYGTFYGIYTLSGGLGPLFTARLVDTGEGYPVALTVHAVLLAVAALLLLRFPPLPAKEEPR